MRTQRTFTFLLSFLFGVLIFSVIGFAAGESLLVDAAKRHDTTAVRGLIAKRANVNETSRDGSTALLWAAYHSDVAMARALITAGANPNLANKYGITPLLQASRTGADEVVQTLLRAGADPALAHPEGETALMAASFAGSLPTVRLLLEANADVNAVDSYQKQTALMRAAAEGHTEVIQALLDAKADPNKKAHVTELEERKHADHATGGFTALMFAARNGHEAAIRALIKGGADPKLTNGDGATPTIIAIVNDRFDLAKTLVELGADPNDGSLYFAVDMHDATSDMRARDGSRLRADHDNALGALDLVNCLNWPSGSAPQDPKDLKVPVLLLGVQNDPIVGNEGVAAVAATVINAGSTSKRVMWQGIGHGATIYSSCALPPVLGYLDTGNLPATDIYCPA